jgi:hypothetical protein
MHVNQVELRLRPGREATSGDMAHGGMFLLLSRQTSSRFGSATDPELFSGIPSFFEPGIKEL